MCEKLQFYFGLCFGQVKPVHTKGKLSVQGHLKIEILTLGMSYEHSYGNSPTFFFFPPEMSCHFFFLSFFSPLDYQENHQ